MKKNNIKLGLLGKDIKHSKSHQLYEELLSHKIEYHKYDIDQEVSIPSLDEIFRKVDGLSITSPYKPHFLKEVSVNEEIKKLNSINCIKKENDQYFATNTDYLALIDILSEYQTRENINHLILLGDGVMSRVTQLVADKLFLSWEVFSRKKTESFYDLHLGIDDSRQILYINTCSREFSFSGTFDSGIFFLDYNYNFLPHQKTFQLLKDRYVDGMGLLKKQAEYALKFWKITD